MANIEKIVLPDNTEYDVKDASALPKTAGSSQPLTGDLYINNETDPSVRFCDAGGTQKGYIGSTGDTVRIINSTGSCGLRLLGSAGTTNLYTNGENILFSPNGYSSTTGRMTLYPNGDLTVGGQIYGGVTETTKSSTSSVSCTGTTWATAVSVTGLSSTGYYIAVGQLTYNPSSSSGHTPRCRLITAGGTELAQQCVYMAVNTSVPFNVFGMMHGSTGFTLQCSPQASAITNGTISSGAKLVIFRVG